MSEDSGLRYDIIYASHDEIRIEPHFCREIGCHGFNESHGATWEQAREAVAKYYEGRAAHWRMTPEPVDE